MKKRIVSALLISACILSAVSCGKETAPVTDGTTSAASGETSSAAETTETKLKPDLENRDFGGAEFIIVDYQTDDARYYMNCNYDVDSDEANGDPINDAVYSRNSYVEEKYNCKITEYGTDAPSGTVTKTILSGDDVYDIIIAPPKKAELSGMASNNYLYDLNSLKYLDFSKPWWDQGAVSDLSIAGKLFFCTGDIIILDDSQSWIVYFNKKIFDNYNMEYPYDLVREGKWTVDKLYELATKMSADLNGDSKMDENDQFGLISEYSDCYNLIAGFGEKIADHDADGKLKITAYNERVMTGLDKVIKLFNDKNNVITCEDYSHLDNYWEKLLINQFVENRSAMIISYLNGVTCAYRDMESDFGLLPLPKLDESQSEYHTPVNFNFSSAVAIPVSNQNPDDAAFILEAMAAESMYTLTPAFVEISMKRKQSRDEESVEMLDIIMSSLTYDIGQFYNWGGLYSLINREAKNGANTFASDYAANEKNAQSELDRIVNNIQ